MPTTETSIFFQQPELATPEEDVRIEVIKALLNKSDLNKSLIQEIAYNLLYISRRPPGADIFHISDIDFANYFDINKE